MRAVAKPSDWRCRPLNIDNSLAEAHASLAWATMLFDYDFAAAEREFERSIELNPRYATAHQWFGMSLALMGRYEEGYTELKRAIRLDPSSSVIQWGLGFVCLFARRYDQAIEQFEKALQLDPNSVQVQNGLGLAYLYKSMHTPAIAAFRKAEQLSQGALVAILGDACAAAGNPDEARKTLEQLKELSKQRYVSPYLALPVSGNSNNLDANSCFGESTTPIGFISLGCRIGCN